MKKAVKFFTEVNGVSKFLALALFIILPVIAFIFGTKYQEKKMKLFCDQPIIIKGSVNKN